MASYLYTPRVHALVMPLSFGFGGGGEVKGGNLLVLGLFPMCSQRCSQEDFIFIPYCFGHHHGSTSKYITCKGGKLRGGGLA
jgi:hypothetical protein